MVKGITNVNLKNDITFYISERWFSIKISTKNGGHLNKKAVETNFFCVNLYQ